MPLVLNDETLVHTIWFVGWDGGDLLGYVTKEEGKGWKAEYRLRTHKEDTDDPFLDNDDKYFFEVVDSKNSEDPERLVKSMDYIAVLTKESFEAEIFDKLEIKGYGEDVLRAMGPKSWCFIKTMPLERN